MKGKPKQDCIITLYTVPPEVDIRGHIRETARVPVIQIFSSAHVHEGSDHMSQCTCANTSAYADTQCSVNTTVFCSCLYFFWLLGDIC